MEQIPRALQSHRSKLTICLPPVRFHRAAKFCRSQRRPGPPRQWEGIGSDVLLMGGTLCPGSFLFAISNSRHAGRCASSDGDALNWSLRHAEFTSQISVTARPEKAADLKPATRCVLNKQRGKQGSLRGGIPAFYSNCVFLCCCPAARNYLFEPLAFQQCCTNTGVYKKMMTFPSLL